eukprot:13304639-Ditylum_brightwellii.AAC.2
MPRDRKDPLPAFHQIGKVQREHDIQGIFIPSLVPYAANFGRKVVHYYNAVLKSKGGSAHHNMILSPEACMQVNQYEYNFATHKIKPKNMELHKDKYEDGIKGFDEISTPSSQFPFLPIPLISQTLTLKYQGRLQTNTKLNLH